MNDPAANADKAPHETLVEWWERWRADRAARSAAAVRFQPEAEDEEFYRSTDFAGTPDQYYGDDPEAPPVRATDEEGRPRWVIPPGQCLCGHRAPYPWNPSRVRVEVGLRRLSEDHRTEEWEDDLKAQEAYREKESIRFEEHLISWLEKTEARMKALKAPHDELKEIRRTVKDRLEKEREDRSPEAKKARRKEAEKARKARLKEVKERRFLTTSLAASRTLPWFVRRDDEVEYRNASDEFRNASDKEIEEAAKIALSLLPEFKAWDSAPLAFVLFDAWQEGECIECRKFIEEAGRSPEVFHSLRAFCDIMKGATPTCLREWYDRSHDMTPAKSGRKGGRPNNAFRDAYLVRVMMILKTQTGMRMTRPAGDRPDPKDSTVGEGDPSICSIMAKTDAVKAAGLTEIALEKIMTESAKTRFAPS